MNGQELIHGQNHTHLPLLMLAVHQSTGPVLELGCGDASTVNLHSMLAGSGRMLYSLDDNPDWTERYASLRTEHHQIARVDYPSLEFKNEGKPRAPFGVVFIDHAPLNQRVTDILRLKDAADFIVIHDTDAAEGQAFDAIWPHFKYRFDDRRFRPWTTVVSNVRPLAVDWG